jgi:hypothetical protein
MVERECVVYWYSIQYPLHHSGYASRSRVVETDPPRQEGLYKDVLLSMRDAGGSALCRYNDNADIAPTHLCSTSASSEVEAFNVWRSGFGFGILITQTPRGEACILATRRRGTRVRTYVEINTSCIEKPLVKRHQ